MTSIALAGPHDTNTPVNVNETLAGPVNTCPAQPDTQLRAYVIWRQHGPTMRAFIADAAPADLMDAVFQLHRGALPNPAIFNLVAALWPPIVDIVDFHQGYWPTHGPAAIAQNAIDLPPRAAADFWHTDPAGPELRGIPIGNDAATDWLYARAHHAATLLGPVASDSWQKAAR